MIKSYLKSISLFASLSDFELDSISSLAKERIYKKGNVVVSEGNKRDFIYVIKSGKVKIYKTSDSEKSVILDIKGERSALGISVLFSDFDNPVTIKTIEDSILYVFKVSDIEYLASNNISFSLDIIKNLNQEIFSFQNKIKSLALDDSYAKVVILLLDLSEKYGNSIDENSVELSLTLTRYDMADMIGVSRETVSRILNQLIKEKIISIDDKKISILNKPKLREWLK